jgi:hypothetical protein
MRAHITSHKHHVINQPEVRKLLEDRCVECAKHVLADGLRGHAIGNNIFVPTVKQLAFDLQGAAEMQAQRIADEFGLRILTNWLTIWERAGRTSSLT